MKDSSTKIGREAYVRFQRGKEEFFVGLAAIAAIHPELEAETKKVHDAFFRSVSSLLSEEQTAEPGPKVKLFIKQSADRVERALLEMLRALPASTPRRNLLRIYRYVVDVFLKPLGLFHD
ncbi:MAG: hypothetical protein Q8K86_07365 [Candidatus Nanopelagicaceae bacterium]|nr:hypothetical protein [Candidatus Nanopelagicaceae bacterium]